MNGPFNRWTLKRLGIIPVFFLSLIPGCYAQILTTDAISIALAGCYASGPGGSSGIYNEAVLGYDGHPVYHISHVRPFVIKELGVSSVSTQFPLFPGNLKIGLQHYGIPGYQQLSSSLGYGMKLSEKIYAGIGFRYYNTITQGELSYLRTLGLSGGILARTGEKTWLGLHIINPVTISNYPEYGAIFPSIITLGVRTEIYESSSLYSELSYHSETGLTLRIATDYHCSEKLVLRAGYHSHPTSFSLGTGVILSPIQIDLAFGYSVSYGIIPAIGITYLPGK